MRRFGPWMLAAVATATCSPGNFDERSLEMDAIVVEPDEFPVSFELSVLVEGDEAPIVDGSMDVSASVDPEAPIAMNLIRADGTPARGGDLPTWVEVPLPDEGPFEERWIVTFEPSGQLDEPVTIEWDAEAIIWWESRNRDGFDLDLSARPFFGE